MSRRRILILTGYYYPSVKAGGPIQSIRNLINTYKDKYDFYILTSDRDLDDANPFDSIETDQWTKVENASVYYTDFSKLNMNKMAQIINNLEYNLMYLNSFFSFKISIMPLMLRKLKKIPDNKIVLAPRGEFHPSALGMRSLKKRAYLLLSRLAGFYEDIRWHATNDVEVKEIQKTIGYNEEVVVAKNLSINKKFQYRKIKKSKGYLDVVFLSRIHPKKNLIQALSFLRNINGQIIFNIFGPIEDREYWQECQRIIEELPENINVTYKGIVENHEVYQVFQNHHVFLFPTLGENFGHVISEALLSACPVVISDQTPWRNLQDYQAGWDISLSNSIKFTDILNYLVNMEQEEYNKLSHNAITYGKRISEESMESNEYERLFCK